MVQYLIILENEVKVLVAQLHLTLCEPVICPWNSPGKNTGVGSHSLLQGIFMTQGLNLGLLHCRQILYHLTYQGSCMTIWVSQGQTAFLIIFLIIHTY